MISDHLKFTVYDVDLAQVRWPTSPRLSLKGVLAADPAHWQNWAEGLIAGEKLNPLEWSEKRRHVSSVYVINKNKTMHEGWWGLPDVFFSKKKKNDHVSNNSSIEPTFWGLIYIKAPEIFCQSLTSFRLLHNRFLCSFLSLLFSLV